MVARLNTAFDDHIVLRANEQSTWAARTSQFTSQMSSCTKLNAVPQAQYIRQNEQTDDDEPVMIEEDSKHDSVLSDFNISKDMQQVKVAAHNAKDLCKTGSSMVSQNQVFSCSAQSLGLFQKGNEIDSAAIVQKDNMQSDYDGMMMHNQIFYT